MESRIKVCVLCGGQSAEHEISVLSASNVIAALDPQKYDVRVVYIGKNGIWYGLSDLTPLLNNALPRELTVDINRALVLSPGCRNMPLALRSNIEQQYRVDCFLPILHGTRGEDGAVQGLLDVLGIPYVGSGVLGSSTCMAKHVTKTLLRAAGLPTVNWCVLRDSPAQMTYEEIQQQFGDVLFIKPASLGSSIGIQKVTHAKQFAQALKAAWRYDDVAIVEQAIQGRELEVSVLGNESPVASLAGEIKTRHDFYTYTAKYLDPDGAQLIMPADLPANKMQALQNLAIQAFQVLECSGLARVDFFMTNTGDLLINEVNTIPGFTNISMYPKLWALSGIEYSELIDSLITLALAKHRHLQNLSRDWLQSSAETISESVSREIE